MAKLTEAEKRKNFERTVGSSENDMEPRQKEKGLELLTKEQYNKLPKIKPGSPAFSDLKSAPPGVDVDEKGNIEYKKKGGMIKSSASKRADGIAIRGKTRA